jgi:glycosyltransferase involved in cell wall biosynthesis
MKKLIVAGAYPSGAGYPNASNTLARLTVSGRVSIEYAGADLGQDLRLWKEARRGWIGRIIRIVKMGWHNTRSVVDALRKARGKGACALYIPHPPLPTLLLLSLLPARWRPLCIADAYISVWDSLVRDRQMLAEDSLAARLLRRIEVRGLSVADRVIVDTHANARMLIESLGLRASQLAVLPLAINEGIYQQKPYVPMPGRGCKVLFVGTLVPLHGMAQIALRELEGLPGLEFTLIGDGQDAHILSEYLASGPRLDIKWMRQWLNENEISSAISDSDICLGIFGGGGKAARVLPFKLYSYFRVGRAVISQREFGSPANSDEIPFFPVDGRDAKALATAIRHLSNCPDERAELARRGAQYYERYLGCNQFLKCWEAMLCDGGTHAVHR